MNRIEPVADQKTIYFDAPTQLLANLDKEGQEAEQAIYDETDQGAAEKQ